MGSVYTLINQKGGVGKTTTVVNLACWAALDGRRVLIVDADPQGNASSGLGVNRKALERCAYDMLVGAPDGSPTATASEVILKTGVENLMLIPATLNLAGADMALSTAIARERRLRQSLEPVRDDFDLIFIDTPPSLGILSVNALVASDFVIIPIQCEYYALEGVSQLLNVIGIAQAQLNPDLRIAGAVLTMYDSRTNLSEDVAAEVRADFEHHVFRTVIPRNVQLAEAPSYGQPIAIYAPSSRGAKRYYALYKEVFSDDQA
ncbi:MAG TPA: sporulation initiation inhibitor Soj [Armatimonadetes bacterium]|nr:sporulation initiation inhibitor Soj [Armatimonadota bacterium]